MKIRGIYKIQSKIKPECVYIGSSENINGRWSEHRSHMRHNKHKNPKIQNHYNKYGLDDFIFQIIEECSLEDKLSREQYYIDIIKPWFNSCPIAGNTTGRKFSEETLNKLRNPSENTRLKQSISARNRPINSLRRPIGYISPLKNRKLSESHIKNMILSSKGIPILQFDLNGNFIREWHGVKTASKELKIPSSTLSDCLKSGRNQSYGFLWKYKDQN